MAPPKQSIKGIVGRLPAQRHQPLTPTKKQSEAVKIEAEAAKQMVDAQRKPYIKLTPDPYLTGFESNGWYTPLNWTEDLTRSIYQANEGVPQYLLDNKVYNPFYKEMSSSELPQYNKGQNALNPIDNAIDRAIEEGTPEAFIQLKDISDSQFQDWKNRHPESVIDVDWLKTVRDDPSKILFEKYRSEPYFDYATRQKENNNLDVAEPPFYSLFQTDVNGPGHFSIKNVRERQIRPTNSNYGELGYTYLHTPDWDPQWSIKDYNIANNIEFIPMYNPHYPKGRLYYKPDVPDVFTEAPDVNIGTGVNTKVGAGALTGLGVLAYPYLFSDNNEETLSKVPQEQPVIKSVSEPTSEQQYVSQGKPYDSRPPQSYPVEEDFDSSQVPLASQRTNALIRDAYDFIHSNTPVETNSDNFIAPRELPANGETLDEYNSDSTPKSGVILASDDTTPVNEPRVLNKPTNTRKPIIVNKPQKQVTPAPVPVSAESALVQNALSRENLAKRDRAFRNAKYAALNANLAGREDALQRARYQSLINSGLRGMSPSEAIKSGLLTPEQAYVLMRGPF